MSLKAVLNCRFCQLVGSLALYFGGLVVLMFLMSIAIYEFF